MVDNERYEARFDDQLHLLSAASSNVAEEPDSLLVYLLLVVRQQIVEVLQRATVQHLLRLLVCTSDNITHCSESSCLQFGEVME